MVLDAIRRAKGLTRANLVAATGLARGTIGLRLEQLEARNLIRVADGRETTGGRPAGFLTFNHQAGIILAADIGSEHAFVGITDLSGSILQELSAAIDAAEGPDSILDWLEAQFEILLRQGGHRADEIRGVGISVAAPVDHMTGRPMRPPIMPGWDGYDIAGRLGEKFNTSVSVDKDANLMALAEQQLHYEDVRHMMFVKVATGIGSGIVLSGRVHHGVDGAAGDIGHVPVPNGDTTICRCGNVGCLEAVASGDAIARRLTEMGIPAKGPRDVLALLQAGDGDATRLVRESGRRIGEILVSAVNILNPELVVVGGDISRANELLLAGVRSVVYQRSLPLATRRLRIVNSRLENKAGLIGAALMAIDRAMSPPNIDRLVSQV